VQLEVAGVYPVDMNILPIRHLISRKLRQNPERMSPEIIPLSLQQPSGETFTAIPVKPTERGTKCGRGDSETSSFGNDVTPRGLSFMNCFVEEIIKQQVFQFVVLYKDVSGAVHGVAGSVEKEKEGELWVSGLGCYFGRLL
jgi:hypothetical protein